VCSIVGNPRLMLLTNSKGTGVTRVFSIGFGSDACRNLISNLASAGSGLYEYLG